jgi:hypothetical protein
VWTRDTDNPDEDAAMKTVRSLHALSQASTLPLLLVLLLAWIPAKPAGAADTQVAAVDVQRRGERLL